MFCLWPAFLTNTKCSAIGGIGRKVGVECDFFELSDVITDGFSLIPMIFFGILGHL